MVARRDLVMAKHGIRDAAELVSGNCNIPENKCRAALIEVLRYAKHERRWSKEMIENFVGAELRSSVCSAVED